MSSPSDEILLNILASKDDKARGSISILFCIACCLTHNHEFRKMKTLLECEIVKQELPLYSVTFSGYPGG